MNKTNLQIYPNVTIGDNAELAPYTIIGEPQKGKKSGEMATIIGDNAVIRSHTVIYAGNRIGDNFQTGHGVLLREENEIGNNVSIGSHSVVEHHVKIGNSVRIHSQAFIPEFSVLEDECWIGPNVVLTNAVYPLSPDAKINLKGPIIEYGAKIGANATLLPGVIIGKGALVGAGAVVTKDVPEGAVVAGNPARVINHTSNLGAYSFSER